MPWILLKVKSLVLKEGTNPIIQISDSDYITKEDFLYAFTVKWAGGEVDHLVLNPKEQKISTWKTELDGILKNVDDFLDKVPFGVGKALPPIALIGGGLRWKGPAGLLVGALGVFAKAGYQMWSKANPDTVYKVGYYDRDTHEKSTLFTIPLKLTDLIVLDDKKS